MRKYISENKDIFNRFDKIENNISNLNDFKLESNTNFNKIFTLLNQNPKPDKGIFFEGQLFDSHIFISDLIRSAKTQIKLIDNYINEQTLNLFTKTKVKVTLYTKNITKELNQDLNKYNSQYNNIIL